MANNITTEQYSDDYKEACFYAWYKDGRNKFSKEGGAYIQRIIPTAENGRKPQSTTIKKWYHEYGWEQRADALDAELSKRLDEEAIAERAKIYTEIAEKGKELLQKGYDYIQENNFDTSASAVRAIGLGAEMIAKFGNAADILLAIHDMSNKQIISEISKILSQSDSDTIDAELEEADSSEDAVEDYIEQDSNGDETL